jgi:3-hydroxyacyl-CoA dehydrogenase
MMQSFHGVEYQRRDGAAVITMNNPPVNGLSHAVRLGLEEAFTHAIDDPHVSAVVLTGRGKGFSAGGDIRELGTPAATAQPALSLQVHPIIERCRKPTVAALHGIAIGGGLETALVCHYRVAAAGTRVALPEIKLGLIPLSGTQRLPRVLGLCAAIDFILEARTMQAREFPPDTLFDEVIDAQADAIVERAVERALAAAPLQAVAPDRSEWLPLVRHRPIVRPDDLDAVLARARQRAAEIGPVAVAALGAIAAVLESPDFDAGMKRAREIYDVLSVSDAVRLHRDRFLESERE